MRITRLARERFLFTTHEDDGLASKVSNPLFLLHVYPGYDNACFPSIVKTAGCHSDIRKLRRFVAFDFWNKGSLQLLQQQLLMFQQQWHDYDEVHDI